MKFTKKNLIDQLGFKEEDAEIVLQYQKKLPILAELEDIDGFCVDAKALWEQLERPQSRYRDWVRRKFTPYGFRENVDFVGAQKCAPENTGVSGMDQEMNHVLTLDMAKGLAMIDKKECGILARRYYVLMERAVKDITKWNLIRMPLRKGYCEMDRSLHAYMNRTVQRDADKYDYTFEANMLNIIATGFTAQEIRNYIGVTDNITRDHLTETYNSYLLRLQEWDTAFLNMNMNRFQRCEMLLNMFNATFKDPLLLKGDSTKEIVDQNKQRLLQDLRNKTTYTPDKWAVF